MTVQEKLTEAVKALSADGWDGLERGLKAALDDAWGNSTDDVIAFAKLMAILEALRK